MVRQAARGDGGGNRERGELWEKEREGVGLLHLSLLLPFIETFPESLSLFLSFFGSFPLPSLSLLPFNLRAIILSSLSNLCSLLFPFASHSIPLKLREERREKIRDLKREKNRPERKQKPQVRPRTEYLVYRETFLGKTSLPG